MDGDMNDIFQKLNSMLSDKETSENLKNILNNFSSSNSSTSDNNSTKSQNGSSEFDNNKSNSENFNFNNSNEKNSSNSDNINFDINTILKIKSIMDAMNANQTDSRSQLLLSLKPYLRSSKKDKIDQYVKMLNLANVMQVLNKTGGENKKHDE